MMEGEGEVKEGETKSIFTLNVKTLFSILRWSATISMKFSLSSRTYVHAIARVLCVFYVQH